MLQPPYSPDLSPSDFLLFPRLMKCLKGCHFGTMNNIQKTVTDLLKSSSTVVKSGRNVSDAVLLPKEITLKMGLMCNLIMNKSAYKKSHYFLDRPRIFRSIFHFPPLPYQNHLLAPRLERLLLFPHRFFQQSSARLLHCPKLLYYILPVNHPIGYN